MPTPNRHLVVCRVGPGSLHAGWLGDPQARSYDVWLDAVDEAARPAPGGSALVSVGPGTTKWPRMAALLAQRPEAYDYDAVWFPDDDLAVDAAGVERLFETFHALGVTLAQPALSDGSYFSFPFTLENRAFHARFTNCVEVMAPLFSRAALRTCAPTFGESVSGWGLDLVWPRLLGDPRDGLAVLDAAPVRHTRPIGSGDWYRSLGVDPAEERRRLLAHHGVAEPFVHRQFGGIPRPGPIDRAAAVDASLGMLVRLAGGVPSPLSRGRRFWSRLAKSVGAGRLRADG